MKITGYVSEWLVAAAIVGLSATGVYGKVLEMDNGWYVINDSVMGGISQSSMIRSVSGTLLFSGNVSLENNGGFASIRHAAKPLLVDKGKGIHLRLRGDGKIYQFRIRTTNRFDGMAYKADFSTEKDQWQDVHLYWDQFTPTFRGYTIPDAPELDPSEIKQIGFLIADKQHGDFQLEIQLIKPM